LKTPWLFLCCFLCLGAGYAQQRGGTPAPGGPSILSRGAGGGVGRDRGEPLKFRAFASVLGSYDTGLTSVTTDQEGNFRDDDAYGAQALIGIYGNHEARRGKTSLDYRGSYRHYSNARSYSGMDHHLSLGHTHTLGRKWRAMLHQSASTYGTSQGLGGLPLNIGDFNFNVFQIANPGEEVFDGRTYAAMSGGGLRYAPTRGLSVGLSGGAFFVRRQAKAQAGMNGYRAGADVGYRIGRRSQVGVEYGHVSFQYLAQFGRADIDSLGAQFSTQLGRNWGFGVGVGGFRSEMERLIRVRPDPLVARLLGARFFMEAFHGISYGTQLSAGFTGHYRTSGISAHYRRGVVPGNGIYLASTADQVNAGYSYSGIRGWGLGANANYARYHTLLQQTRGFESISGGFGASRHLTGMVHLSTRIQFGHVRATGTGYVRDRMSLSAGLSFSPGELPLSLW